jgi:hypothetical protein
VPLCGIFRFKLSASATKETTAHVIQFFKVVHKMLLLDQGIWHLKTGQIPKNLGIFPKKT